MSSSLTAGTGATAEADAEAASLTETAEGCVFWIWKKGTSEGEKMSDRDY